VKRKSTPRPTKPPRARADARPAPSADRHSGEGSASALETLQRIERRRQIGKTDPRSDEPRG
jgi:hypothetical protein